MKSFIQDLVCVTNRKLCKEDIFIRIEKIVKYKPRAILLREKEISESEYEEFAKDMMSICEKEDVQCVLHNFVSTAIKLKAKSFHLTFPALRTLTAEDKKRFIRLGASCHTVEEARKAEMAGCNRVIAGHLFDTMNKRQFEQNDLDFFKDVIRNVTIPVFAIGGINKSNIAEVMNSGTIGVAVMTGPMQCENIDEYFKGFIM